MAYLAGGNGPEPGNGNSRTGPPNGYLPIEEHGIVGDLRTVALVGTDGTVDWYCPSRFDAPSLFGALLDTRKGGYFSLWSRTSHSRPKQLYLPDTNILLTRFQGKEAVGEVIDFMVPETRSTGRARDVLVRQARAVRGRATFELACHPAFDYGRASHSVDIIQDVGAVFTSALGRAVLRTNVPLKAEEQGVAATFTLEEGESADIHLEWNGEVRPITEGETDDLLTRTQDFWQSWVSQSSYRGPLARDGATVRARAQAARLPPDRRPGRRADHVACRGAGRQPQLGLPLRLAPGRLVHGLRAHAPRLPRGGGELHGLAAEALRDGHGGTRRHDHVHRRRQRSPHETTLGHLDGYHGAKPVRIGNGAVGQRQLDVYGEIMDSVYLYNKEVPISYDLWTGLSKRLDWLSKHWTEPDEGIWEIRGPRQRFTYSALMTLGRLRARGPPGERPRPARPGRTVAQAGRARPTGSSRSSAGTPA